MIGRLRTRWRLRCGRQDTTYRLPRVRRKAFELGLADRPDVVIADWMLGGDLHGGEVCRRIRAACPSVKTIIMTGYLDGASEVEQWSEYAETLLEKPFHQEAILEAVNRALSCAAAC